MDSLTHGLLGLAVGALRKPDGDRNAVLLACVLAAELPDLDYLWPADNSVLHTLRAHRGLSHALVFAPLVALVAALLAKLVFRRARVRSLLLWSLPSVVFAHLLADAWTGWGTRLALPFSSARVSLDWMMVVDPLFTLPLLAGALWGLKRRTLLRRAVLIGAAVSCVYLAGRIALRAELAARVRAAHPGATEVQVFPSWWGPAEWRYVAAFATRYSAGRVGLFGQPEEQAVRARPNEHALGASPDETVREALAWARFPLIDVRPRSPRGTRLSIADLRYHLNGAPTLSFELELDEHGRAVTAQLERGGSAASLWQRAREAR